MGDYTYIQEFKDFAIDFGFASLILTYRMTSEWRAVICVNITLDFFGEILVINF